MTAMRRTFRNWGGRPWWFWRSVSRRRHGKPWSIGDLTASALSATEVQLAFTANGGSESYEYRVDGGAAAVLADDLIVTGLTAATEYDFEVRGVNGSRYGEWSNVATETTEAA